MNVLSSLDRYLSVKYPTKFKFREKFKFQLIAILLLCSLVSLIDAPFAILADINNSSSCSGVAPKYMPFITNQQASFFMVFLSALMETILPCSIMVLSTCFIGYELIVLKKKTVNKKNFKKEKKMLKTLSSLNIFFFITTAPYSILILVYLILNGHFYGTLSYYIFHNVYRIYSSFSFFIFLASNTLFREHFISLISCFGKHKKSI